jgi:hypothetical protein
MKHVSPILLIQACLLLFSGGARAADFPPITDQERAVTSVPGEPNAPAVVLFKKGEFLMWGYSYKDGSVLKVQTRLKILTEEGRKSSEITIAHGSYGKLQNFAARTVLPDGRIIPVSADAKFVRKASHASRMSVTAVAFPSVEVGAILDYQYELLVDSDSSIGYLSEDVPVRYAEVVFRTPPGVRFHLWKRSPFGVKIETEQRNTSRGFEVRAWASNLPSVPDDPYGPPYRDLATQVILLPVSITGGNIHHSLHESWPKVCEGTVFSYGEIRRKDGGVAEQARQTAGSGTPRQQAEAIYRFVRDEIETEPYNFGPGVRWQYSLRKVLSERRGLLAEKAILLQAMLKAVKIDSRLVWAADRDRGAIDMQVPMRSWFDRVLVMLELEGQRIFLDPSDRALGFGQLQASYEGTPALICDPKKPEGLVLPETSYDQNLRRAEIDLALDGQGRLAGTGTLRLTGQHAWQRIDWKDDDAQTVQAWKDWLTENFRDFQISEVKAVESPDERQVTVTWSMAQREEEVLGDEARIIPSAPLGPRGQIFVQPASSRRTAVMFDFADREEVELRLRWPEGWRVETAPRSANMVSAVGALSTEMEVREAERTLVFKRRLDVNRRDFKTPKEYEALRSLFADLEKSDAQPVFLARR